MAIPSLPFEMKFGHSLVSVGRKELIVELKTPGS